MQSFTIISALVLGLVAGSSSCLAVSGGLLLSVVGKANDRLGKMTRKTRMHFTLMFVIGRTVSYGLLGGLIGWLGSSFTFSPTATGIITLLAAAYMIIAGLEMLEMAPRWLKCAIPRPPKWLSNRIMDADGHPHMLTPFLLGAATFFLPCGFTQSLQIYALTTASFMTGATILTAFAIGTAPALLALGFASGAMNGKTGKFVLKIAGAFILYLALTNVQNGLTLLDHPIAFASTSGTVTEATVEPTSGYRVVTPGSVPSVKDYANGSVQTIKLKLTGSSPYYSPSNKLSVKAGMPVRIEIPGPAGGCRSVFQISGLGVQTLLNKSNNVVEFTPKKPGRYTFSCSMGMYPGTLTVI